MPTLNVWLLRHGQSQINAGIWQADPANAALTELGREQAEQSAAQITSCPNLIVTSPLLRAQESGQYIMQKWPQTKTEIWPIQELVYLSPPKLQHLSPDEKKERINTYWQQGNPDYYDGEQAESFASFLERVKNFHDQLLTQQGFVVIIGHGMFFKAYQFALTHGFQATSDYMQAFRLVEVANPLRNGEIIKVSF